MNAWLWFGTEDRDQFCKADCSKPPVIGFWDTFSSITFAKLSIDHTLHHCPTVQYHLLYYTALCFKINCGTAQLYAKNVQC